MLKRIPPGIKSLRNRYSRMKDRYAIRLTGTNQRERFERAMLPHLDAAYNLARWLTGSVHDAEDVVQDAFVRALTFFDSFRGEDGRSWLLTIVRNACYDWLRRNRRSTLVAVEQEELEAAPDASPSPEAEQLRKADARILQAGLEALPVEYREALVLRELEGMSYRQIAQVTGTPMGTVMSRLARGRKRLEKVLQVTVKKGELP
jgi:RNA polymerase sigma-70 factor (ECF subfamily)